ncbi:MAG TPA: hypothetical protein VFF30_01935 [Nitrososphaerales archaeon]|nr:hypothetical protein [Nitrososphaerales archaeon]
MLLDSKPNKNILTCGESGAGKSTLNRFLLQHVNDDGSSKIIFMFKPADHYLKAGYPVADLSTLTPNPFLDPDSFVSAFAIAFPISMIGITASQIPSLVRDLVFGCASWNDFNSKLSAKIKETTDRVQLTALYFIQQQIKSLQLGRQEKAHSIGETEENPINLLIQNGTSLVVDFSKLSADSAKVFHAELLLRQIWANMPNQEKLVVCVDEAHRLTRGTFEKYHSILYEIGREIRARGALWASTQNYSDIDDGIRNQFATQFVLHTSSKADLEALRAIDPMLSWAAAGLRPHRFVDAKSAQQLHYEIHILTFSSEGLIDKEPMSIEEYLSTTTLTLQPKKVINYEAIIEEKIKEAPIWISGMASFFADNFGVDKDTAKLKVKDILQKFINADELQRMKFDMLSGETVVMYFKKSDSDQNESPLHKWMVRQAVENSEADSEIIHVATSGESTPDIELASFFIECETSLKKRTDDLEERSRKFSPVKPMIILVPNSDSIQTYQRLASERVTVTTFKNYKQSIRSKAHA